MSARLELCDCEQVSGEGPVFNKVSAGEEAGVMESME
jgi:hypothetical protein